MGLALILLALIVAVQYVAIGVLVVPRLARLATGGGAWMRAAQWGATAFFLGCGVTHLTIAWQTWTGGSMHAAPGWGELLLAHVLPHVGQVVGGMLFLTVVQSRLEVQLMPKELARRLRELEARFRAAFEHTSAGLALVSLEPATAGRFIQVNPALSRMLGYSSEELVGRRYRNLMHPEDLERDVEVLDDILAQVNDEVELEHRLVHRDGHPVWVQVSSALVRDQDGIAAAGVASIRDVTAERHHDEQLRHLADHDALTGVFSRRRFEEELDRVTASVARYGEPAALLVVDVDRFKYINDTYGHVLGDQVLNSLAAVLRSRIRETDVIGRLGGDEFGVLCSHTDGAGAGVLATGLLQAVRDEVRVRLEGRDVRLTVSVGIKCIDGTHPLDSEQVGVQADSALYEAKEAGRDRYCLVPPDSGGPARMRSRLTWSERIRDALEHDRLQLWEQPILNLATGRCDRSELLIRMIDPEDGSPIPPVAFLDTAERFGQIQAIDAWVCNAAVDLLRERQRNGDTGAIEINLSGASLTDEALVDLLVERIGQSGVDPDKLIVEITETAAISNFEIARQFATRLADLGCRLALDDFGSGFGSFYYLKHLPFDCVKIDGDFIKHLPASPADRLTVEAIVTISRGLGKDITAEFVEDDPTLQVLRELGVHHAQGYHIGRPQPVAAAVA